MFLIFLYCRAIWQFFSFFLNWSQLSSVLILIDCIYKKWYKSSLLLFICISNFFWIFPCGPPYETMKIKVIKFWEASENHKSSICFYKISAVYFMWNPEICQDPPTCGQDDPFTLIAMLNLKFDPWMISN